jgi:CheY-like chemotaxis protein
VIKRVLNGTPIRSLGRIPSTTVEPADIRVLVVDDDDTARASKVAPLRLNDFKVSEADGIESALISLRKSQFDVVVLDMHMPNRDGADDEAGLVVLREIATWDSRPSAIVFTVGVSKEHTRLARKLGAVVLSKARDIRKLPIQVCAAWSDRRESLLGRNGA